MGVGMLRRYHKAAGQASEPDDPAFPEGEPAESWKVDELRAFAKAHEIDLGGAKTKAEILAALAPQPPANT